MMQFILSINRVLFFSLEHGKEIQYSNVNKCNTNNPVPTHRRAYVNNFYHYQELSNKTVLKLQDTSNQCR